MRQAKRQQIAAAALFALTLLASCGPEDGRVRGGEPGGDANNKPAQIQPASKVFASEGQP